MIAGSRAKASRMEPADFGLSALMGCLAVHSVALALSRPLLGYALMGIVVAGSAMSYAISRLLQGRMRRVDAYVYFASVLASFAAVRVANPYLPDEGFPRELVILGVLCWMVALGSWAAWNDATLLFQAVPCISIFALVGAIDTFKSATFVFFFFLICAATLYARAHHRVMLARAEDSGYRDLKRIRQGPWRWIAGPEWAVGSAFVVVIASLLGAPVIQQSVQGVAGAVTIVSPVPLQALASAVGAPTSPSIVRIGQGPRFLTERPVFRAKLDRPRYLRMSTYPSFTGNSWTRPTASDSSLQAIWSAMRADRARLLRSGSFRAVDFELVFESAFVDAIPVPGEVIELSPAVNWQRHADGTIAIPGGVAPQARFRGRAAVHADSVRPEYSPLPLPEFLQMYVAMPGAPNSVVRLADQVCEGLTTDLEKAQAIKSEIERRVRYNLHAEPVPEGVNAVEHFLFGQREGYCDLFASAMAIMARTQGIPARVATGYFPISDARPENGWYVLRESDAHMWAELYFEGVGWVVFDPTEGATAVAGGELGSPTVRTPFFERPWFRVVSLVFLAVIGVAGGILLLSSLRGRSAKLADETYALAKAYERFAAIVARITDRPRRAWETPYEYIAAVEPMLGKASASARLITDRFEVAFYANGHPDKPTASALLEEIGRFKALAKDIPRSKSRSEGPA